MRGEKDSMLMNLLSRHNLIVFFSLMMMAFNIYILGYFPLDPFKTRGFFIAVSIVLVALAQLESAKTTFGKASLMIFTFMALGSTIYVMVAEDNIINRFFYATETEVYVTAFFLLGMASLIYYLPGGKIILAMVGGAILYLLAGHKIPGLFGHDPFPLTWIASMLFTEIDIGAFGVFADIGTRVISIFLIFATLLLVSGLGDFFTATASLIAGNATGGPAKVASLSSATFGMISGTAVSNVTATGSFTIPLMKKIGYTPSMAASIEAVSSCGGMLMPPIMGVVAFLMADLLGTPYLHICVVAIIPVFLWYFTVFIVIHYTALKQRVRKWRPSLEELKPVIQKRFHLVFAIPALVIGLVVMGTPEQGAFYSVIFLIGLTFLRRDTRLNRKKVAEFAALYARTFAPLLLLLTILGIFTAALMASGVHLKIATVIIGGVQQWYILLALSFILSVALGMVLPVLAVYLAVIAIIAPLLSNVGFPLLLIHFFVFQSACLAPITPPVALATYAASGIAGSDYFKTGIEASTKTLPLWLIPLGIFKKELFLGIGTPLGYLFLELAILCFGIFIFSLGTTGYFNRDLKIFERALAISIGLLTIQFFSPLISRIFCLVGLLLLVFFILTKGRLRGD